MPRRRRSRSRVRRIPRKAVKKSHRKRGGSRRSRGPREESPERRSRSRSRSRSRERSRSPPPRERLTMPPPAGKAPSRIQGTGGQTLTPGPKAIKSKYHRNPSKNSANTTARSGPGEGMPNSPLKQSSAQ